MLVRPVRSMRRMAAVLLLWMGFGAAFGQDVLSCAPSEANAKSLAICAAAVGGCAAAESFAPSADRGFLQGQACEAMVSQITGQRYDLADFLGSAILSGLNSVANDSIRNGDTWSGLLLKGGLAFIKLWQFSNCVESARATCAMRYRTRLARSGEAYRDSLRATVHEYYGHLSSGDLQSAASRLTPAYLEQLGGRLSSGQYTFQVNDISVLDCTDVCNVAADVTAVPTGKGRQQKWIMSIDLLPIGQGRWQIAKLSGRDIYRELRVLARAYGDALTEGNLDAAAALWLAPPDKLKDLVNNRNAYVFRIVPERSDQFNAFMRVEVDIVSKSNAARRELWSGTSAVVNDAGAWKFASLSLTPAPLQAVPR